MKKKFGLTCLALQWIFSPISFAVSQNAATELQAKLNAMQSMKAHFSQVVKANNRVVSRSSGQMALYRPGRFRWDTVKPMKQLVVADGRQLWVYDVALEQITVRKQAKSVGGTAGLFLSGYNDSVARDFNATMKTEGTKTLFDLHAKSSKANFQQVKLEFNGAALRGIVLYDQLGQRTQVTLSEEKSNSKVSPSLFQFKPPKGVDVIRQ